MNPAHDDVLRLVRRAASGITAREILDRSAYISTIGQAERTLEQLRAQALIVNISQHYYPEEHHPMTTAPITVKQRVYDALTIPMTTGALTAVTGLTRKQVGDNLAYLTAEARVRKLGKDAEGNNTYGRIADAAEHAPPTPPAAAIEKKPRIEQPPPIKSAAAQQAHSDDEKSKATGYSTIVLERLRHYRQSAHAALDAYLDSVCDPEIITPLHRTLDDADRVILRYCQARGLDYGLIDAAEAE